MQHAVAVALTADRVGLDWFAADVVDDATLVDLRDRVTFTVDDSLSYDSHAATVTIETSEGTHRAVCEHPPWIHDEPPTQTVDESAARETFDRLQALDAHTTSRPCCRPSARDRPLTSETDKYECADGCTRCERLLASSLSPNTMQINVLSTSN